MFLKIKNEMINLDKVEHIRLKEDRIVFMFDSGGGINIHSKENTVYPGTFNILLSEDELDIIKNHLEDILDKIDKLYIAL